MMRITRFFLAALLIPGVQPGVAAEKPPIAELRPVTETLHGVKVTDDYRYFEDVESDPKVQKWLRDQASHARAELDRLPRRGELLERIEKLCDGAEANVRSVSRLPCGWFYLKRASGEDQYKLYVRENGVKERMLFDPEIDKTAPMAINYYSPSPGGKYVAVGVSPNGSELVVIRIIDVETGKDTGLEIDRARYWGVTWLDDESGFFYVRSPLVSEDAPETERYQNMSLQFHRMGADPERDFVVLGPSVPGGTNISPTQAPYPHLRHGDSRVFVALVDGVKRDFELWVADVAAALEGKPEWRRLFGEEDQVQYFDVRGGNLYVVTVKDAPRGKLLRVDIEDPDFSKAETLIPSGEQVVEAVSAAKDALYVTLHDGGVSRLRRLPLSGGSAGEELTPPAQGQLWVGINSRMDGALVTLNSWIQGERIYRLENGVFVDTELQPVDPAEDDVRLVAEEVRVPAADGVMIPMSIVHRKGLKRDGSNPCWLNAYGAYGYKSTPRFDPAMVAWFERGGIYATAQVRGGGAYGEEWHRAGMKKTKPNTWRDFIACGEWLISNRYTSAKNLGISGGSAGGITVGRAITERPDIFGAALGGVGVFNPLRSEFSQNGVANIPEFGTITDEEGFLALKEMDSCQHVEKGRRYPAVLLTTGYNDVRVPVWQPAKFAARLQAAGAETVLLRVDYDIGHGAGMTKQQRNELLADEMAFFLNAFEASEEKRD